LKKASHKRKTNRKSKEGEKTKGVGLWDSQLNFDVGRHQQNQGG